MTLTILPRLVNATMKVSWNIKTTTWAERFSASDFFLVGSNPGRNHGTCVLGQDTQVYIAVRVEVDNVFEQASEALQ